MICETCRFRDVTVHSLCITQPAPAYSTFLANYQSEDVWESIHNRSVQLSSRCPPSFSLVFSKSITLYYLPFSRRLFIAKTKLLILEVGSFEWGVFVGVRCASKKKNRIFDASAPLYTHVWIPIVSAESRERRVGLWFARPVPPTMATLWISNVLCEAFCGKQSVRFLDNLAISRNMLLQMRVILVANYYAFDGRGS